MEVPPAHQHRLMPEWAESEKLRTRKSREEPHMVPEFPLTSLSDLNTSRGGELTTSVGNIVCRATGKDPGLESGDYL